MMNPMKRRAFGGAITAGLLAAAACSGKSGAAAGAVASDSAVAGTQHTMTLTADQREHLKMVSVAAETYRPVIQTTGTVAFDGDLSTQVLAPISGPVVRILVQVGTQVRRGDPLALLSSPDFAAAVSAYEKAQSAARQTQRVAQLNAELFKADGIARRDMEQSQVDADAAAADRDAALQQLRALGVDSSTLNDLRDGKRTGPLEATIRAPISGTVVEKLISPGQLLQAGTTACFTVADLSRMWVMANVFESDLAFVAPGDKAQITGTALPQPLSGTAAYVSALVDPSTRATGVRIDVANTGHVLKKDMYVDAAIQSRRTVKGLLIPVSAVLRDDDNLPFVFVETTKGNFARRMVTLGNRIGDRYEVRDGLKEGEQVTAEGGLFLEFAQNQ
jgi:cobalt-zinc-cadmium efflux system membrane fusion protein